MSPEASNLTQPNTAPAEAVAFRRPESLAEVAHWSKTAENLSYNIRDFLDGFYADPKPARLETPPLSLRAALRDDGVADAYLGAIADHLAEKFGFECPPWALADDRRLKKPRFSMNSHGGRMFVLIESPRAFRERNIFVSADALSRA